MPDTLGLGEFEIRAHERRLLRGGQPLALGARAFDLLLALAEHHDRVVSRRELMALVWPGLVVEDNNLSVQMSVLRKLLGPACIATVPGRGYRLTAAVAAPARTDGAAPDLNAPTAVTAVTAAAAVTAATAATAASAQATPLYGRADELASLRQAVLSQSMVTLLGTAGVGKTSLARALANELGPTLPDGAVVAELAPLVDPALVAVTVAAALGLPPAAAVRPEALAAALATRCGLLVLDNCEHLADSVATLASALLAGAPGLHLLATSQVPLQLAQEQRVRLGPLATSTADGACKADADAVQRARQAGAVALFEARAQASDPQFVLTEANVDGVVAICRQLDGVALAIELAAARLRWLGVDGLRTRLQAELGEQLRVLAGGTRLALPRHQTLRAALDWSHALLSSDEQAVFRRLGVFAGGFSLAAVQHLAADEQIDEWAVLDLLGQLIDRSLVVVDFDGSAARAAGAPANAASAPRYRLLQSLREYALAQLQARAELDTWRQRHAAYFGELAFSQGGTTALLRSMAERWPLVLEHDNLRAALDWAAEHDPARALSVAAELLPFWRERGHHAEAQRRCAPLLDDPANQQPSLVRARVRTALCALANERNQTQLIRPLATAVLADARVLGIGTLESMGHIWLAHADLAEDNPAAAADQYRQALAILRQLDEPLRVAETLTNLSCMLIEQGLVDETGPLLAEALALYRAADNVWGQGFVHSTLGEAAYAAGDFTVALASAEQGLSFHRQLQHQHRLSYSLLQCGQMLLRVGRRDEARAHLAEGLAITLVNGFDEQTTIVLVQAALLAADAGEPLRAATLLGAAQANIDRGGALVGRLDHAEFARARQRVQPTLSAMEWDAGQEAGLALSQRDAAALALQS